MSASSLLNRRTITATLVVLSIALPQPLLADAYRWIDKEGNTVFGSTPTKGARSVKRIKTRKLSRYSSTKVLERMGEAHTPDTSKARSRMNSADDSQTSVAETVEDWSADVELIAENPKLDYAADGSVKACSVFVSNKSEHAAANVSVAFEFDDGSLIPASGPNEIAPQSSAEFLIADELLPLKLKNSESTDRKAPRVITHGFKK